jgi:hypothetical protein
MTRPRAIPPETELRWRAGEILTTSTLAVHADNIRTMRSRSDTRSGAPIS